MKESIHSGSSSKEIHKVHTPIFFLGLTPHFKFQCMQESLMMIPDCHRRLEKAVSDLKPLLEELQEEFAEAKEVTEAKEALEQSDEHLKAE